MGFPCLKIPRFTEYGAGTFQRDLNSIDDCGDFHLIKDDEMVELIDTCQFCKHRGEADNYCDELCNPIDEGETDNGDPFCDSAIGLYQDYKSFTCANWEAK